ncbi:MAG: hypothetical protein JWP87_4486 [Labilithrix sp.]|jgi:hypothetical protein|nr:hypothetical protein [Labilithrix sp.]
MATRNDAPVEIGEDDGDRPSSMRVESFLHGIEDRQNAARRTRWIAFAVAAAIGGVATLTAMGIVPVEAENAVLSASAVVAGYALSK